MEDQQERLSDWQLDQKSRQEDLDLYKQWLAHPEGKAREKLHSALMELRRDPEVIASAICVDFLDLIIRISPADVEADTVFELVAPMKAYFNKLTAKSGAEAKLAIDPKQRQKAQVRECWDEWQIQPTRYKSKSAFAKDMLDKYEALVNQTVIVKWCGKWQKEVNTVPN